MLRNESNSCHREVGLKFTKHLCTWKNMKKGKWYIKTVQLFFYWRIWRRPLVYPYLSPVPHEIPAMGRALPFLLFPPFFLIKLFLFKISVLWFKLEHNSPCPSFVFTFFFVSLWMLSWTCRREEKMVGVGYHNSELGQEVGSVSPNIHR